MRLEGKVICFFDEHAFGFVMTDERKTYFLHVRRIHAHQRGVHPKLD